MYLVGRALFFFSPSWAPARLGGSSGDPQTPVWKNGDREKQVFLEMAIRDFEKIS